MHSLHSKLASSSNVDCLCRVSVCFNLLCVVLCVCVHVCVIQRKLFLTRENVSSELEQKNDRDPWVRERDGESCNTLHT